MTTVEEFKRIKKQVEEARKEANKAEGALAEQMKKLQEFGCGTIGEAEQLLKKLEEKTQVAEENYNKALEEFTEKWGRELEEAKETD